MEADRATVLYEQQLERVYKQRDKVFVWLFFAQWIFAITVAVLWSPFGWEGKVRSTHVHVYYAVFFGAAITIPTAIMVRLQPGATINRHVIAVLQMTWSALLIHLTGGRIETHFHVFGSLAFLAFYRDWKVLVPATLAVVTDHLLRGMFWSESVYGIVNPEWWRFLEHAFWVAFEDVVLVMGVVEVRREMRATAAYQAGEISAANRLAAGVAHEINTPIQYISDNVHFMKEANEQVGELLELLRANVQPEARAAVARLEQAMDLDYVMKNVPDALEHSLEGLERVATIVRAMQEFAHPGTRHMTNVDVNRAIETTVNVARNQYKYVADVETDLGDIAPVLGHASELNQALLNLIVNASHAIEDVVKHTGGKGRISIATRQEEDAVVIRVRDTGTGIAPAVRERMFDAFFTTKSLGRGTGQGLAIVRSVIDRHGGTIEIDTEMGRGTTFSLRLPAAAAERIAA